MRHPSIAFLYSRALHISSLMIAVFLGPAALNAWGSAYTLSITATSPDGKNTETARLLSTVSLEATLHAGSHQQVGWKLKGPGSLRSNGPRATYTPPKTMPADTSVTITAFAATYTSLEKSYTLKLLNPVPTISYDSPQLIPGGATTSITLTGKNFMPKTDLQVSSGSVKAVYKSSSIMVGEVTLPSGTTGSVSLKARNPGPGGGSSDSLKVPVMSIQLKAKDPDGANTGTVRLGVPATLVPAVDAGDHHAVRWKLSGPGKLSTESTTDNEPAVYTPPQVMPADQTVTVTAYLSSYPQAAARYSFSLVNPKPLISSDNGVNPYKLLTGGTQSVAITGAGFVRGTVAIHNGSPLSTTFTDYHHVTVHVPVKDNAAGNLKMQMRNPGPGGGLGTSFQVAIADTSIHLTANNGGEMNTGKAEPGDTITFGAAVSGSAKKAVSWKMTGAGSLTNSGIYYAPSAVPSENSARITATLISNPDISASYTLSVVNPTPVIADTSPAEVPAGEVTSISVSGSGFMPGTVLATSAGSVKTTYKSSTSLIAQIKLSDGANGSLSLQAKNPSPGGGLSPFFQEAIASPVSVAAAGRILDQTTFGPTDSLISHVRKVGIDAWLQEQFDAPTTLLATVPTPHPIQCATAAFPCVESEWWKAVITGKDQLRQRVAFALSELFVISTNNAVGGTLPTYANMLANDAFTNWYKIMKDVTLSPGMGIYLDMLNSGAGTNGQIANENFARENMQLFNLGLNLLNQDGSLKLDSEGNPRPTYTQAQVQAFARAFTGWTYANADGSTPSIFIGTPNYTHAMVPVEDRHDTHSKKLLNGTVLPSGQGARADLSGALSNIFEHPNLPPFVSKQLIQHLVTGDPSPEYIRRVADVFVDNGNHVRGDMQSVITAVLTDPEARAGDSDKFAAGGHLREPILWMTGIIRGLGYVNTDAHDFYYSLSQSTDNLNEQPYTAPSVFNFFPPDYVIPGTKMNQPEFALENTASTIDRMVLADYLVHNKLKSFNVDLSASSPLGKISSNTVTLTDGLGKLFLHGQMGSDTRAAIIDELKSVSSIPERVRLATYLVVTSSEYKIMH